MDGGLGLFQRVTVQLDCSGLYKSQVTLKKASSLVPHTGHLRTEVVLGQLIHQPVNFKAAAWTGQKHGRAYE